jgi:hypothetical protein
MLSRAVKLALLVTPLYPIAKGKEQADETDQLDARADCSQFETDNAAYDNPKQRTDRNNGAPQSRRLVLQLIFAANDFHANDPVDLRMKFCSVSQITHVLVAPGEQNSALRLQQEQRLKLFARSDIFSRSGGKEPGPGRFHSGRNCGRYRGPAVAGQRRGALGRCGEK